MEYQPRTVCQTAKYLHSKGIYLVESQALKLPGTVSIQIHVYTDIYLELCSLQIQVLMC